MGSSDDYILSFFDDDYIFDDDDYTFDDDDYTCLMKELSRNCPGVLRWNFHLGPDDVSNFPP